MLSFLSSKEEGLTYEGSHSTSEVFTEPIVVIGECLTGIREQLRAEDA